MSTAYNALGIRLSLASQPRESEFDWSTPTYDDDFHANWTPDDYFILYSKIVQLGTHLDDLVTHEYSLPCLMPVDLRAGDERHWSPDSPKQHLTQDSLKFGKIRNVFTSTILSKGEPCLTENVAVLWALDTPNLFFFQFFNVFFATFPTLLSSSRKRNRASPDKRYMPNAQTGQASFSHWLLKRERHRKSAMRNRRSLVAISWAHSSPPAVYDRSDAGLYCWSYCNWVISLPYYRSWYDSSRWSKCMISS